MFSSFKQNIPLKSVKQKCLYGTVTLKDFISRLAFIYKGRLFFKIPTANISQNDLELEGNSKLNA